MPDININGYPFISQSGTNQPQLTSNVDTKSTFSSLDTSASQGPTTDLTNTTLPIFACRVFVNFNGTSYTDISGENHCAIRASGNVSKVVRNTTGTYTIHFITAMPDTNYIVLGSSIGNVTAWYSSPHGHDTNVIDTNSVKIACPATLGSNPVLQDIDTVQIVIFR